MAKILVLDDSQMMQRYLCKCLEKAGYEVEVWGDPSNGEVEARVAASAPDLILSDFVMPGCNGGTVARIVRKTIPGLPVLILSSFQNEETVARLYNLGVRRVLAKPISPEDLVQAVAVALEHADGSSVDLMAWDQRLETGHPEIDGQHRILIGRVNQLHTAVQQGRGRDEIAETLGFLQDYTVSHFAMEEEIMDQSQYPGADAHKAIHRELVAQVADLAERHRQGTVTLILPVLHFLQDWLTKHIQGEDLRLARFIRGEQP